MRNVLCKVCFAGSTELMGFSRVPLVGERFDVDGGGPYQVVSVMHHATQRADHADNPRAVVATLQAKIAHPEPLLG